MMMWHIRFSGHFMREYDGHWQSLVPHYMRYGYANYDCDTFHFFHKYIVPVAWFWDWYRDIRWLVELYLKRKGILLVEPGYRLDSWKFNWDWRWYNDV